MSNLREYLTNRNTSNLTKSVRISNQIPYDFVIQPLTTEQYNDIQTKRKGKATKNGVDINYSKIQMDIVLQGTVEPNFHDADFIDSVGGVTPEGTVNKVLLAGEFAELYTQIAKLSGFDRDINEDIEEAKN